MKIKICGIQTLNEIHTLNSLMPDYAGFVFAPSKRRISRQLARALLQELCPSIASVAVFKDQPMDEIIDVMNYCPFDVIQLHGVESPESIILLRQVLSPKTEIWKALIAGNASHHKLINSYFPITERLLFDGSNPGSGECYPYECLKDVTIPYMLAGGLTPENIQAPMRQLNPWGVDLSSGVEGPDGYKDPVKIQRLIQNVKEAVNL